MTVNNVNNGLKILLCVHRFDYTCEVQSFENASTNKVKWQKNNKNRKKKSTINQPNHALKLKWNESSIRSHLPYCNVHPSETDYQKRKNIGRDLVLSISCWLDGGRPECELEVDYKKGVEFKQTKWLETSGICHQKEVFHFKGSLSLKWLKLLNYNVNFFTFKKPTARGVLTIIAKSKCFCVLPFYQSLVRWVGDTHKSVWQHRAWSQSEQFPEHQWELKHTNHGV